MIERRNSDFLDLVYDAALEPGLWSMVLERFADMVGGAAGWLSQLDMADGSGGDEADPMVRIDPVWPARYIEHFALRNPLSNVADPHAFIRRWRPRILTDEDWMAKEELVRSEYYNDFMRPQDVHSALMVRLATRGLAVATINIGRPERRGQFTRSDIEVAGRYHPHLIRAFNLGQTMAATQRLNDEMASILDHSPHGLFLLGEAGEARHVNRVGQALLAEPQGLRLIGGRLGAAAPGTARQLQALLGAAASRDPDSRAGGSMSLPTPTRRLPLSLTVAPVRAERFSALHNGPAVLVCVTDLEAGVSLPEQKLRDLFALTPAEARVALAIFEGLSPKEAAIRLGVSFNTVRAQLVRVLGKTGVRRQADLVRLMMRAVGVPLATQSAG